MVQVRHSSGQVHPWLLSFWQWGDAGTPFLHVCHAAVPLAILLISLFLPSLSKTTPSPWTCSSTWLISPSHLEKQVRQGTHFYFFVHPHLWEVHPWPSGTSTMGTFRVCRVLLEVFFPMVTLLPCFFCFVHFCPSIPLHFSICHPLQVLGFLFL